MSTTLLRRKLFALLFCSVFPLLACLMSASEQDVTCAFIAPSGSLLAGSRISLWLYCMNNSSNEVQGTFETNLNARFVFPAGTSNTVLQLNPLTSRAETTIAPGAFAREEYLLNIPSPLRGPVTLDISNYNQLALRVEQVTNEVPPPNNPPNSLPSTLNSNSGIAAPPPSAIEPSQQRSRFALVQYLGNHLTPYEPIYFLLGNYPAAEFQFSLKYQLFDFTNSWFPLTNLYFAYTQTSFWDLISSDPSFFDTSYKPSIFAYHPEVFTTSRKFFRLDLQGGAEHESNGRGGTMERSLYTAYLQPTFIFGRPGHVQLTLQPRAWTYFWVGHNNPDIAQFRGYADLVSALTLKNDPNSWANFQIASRFRIGDEGDHAGIQIDLRYKIPHFNPAIDLQYFTGYGQTLRQYNVESHGFRAGLCIWYWPDFPEAHTAK